MSYLKKISGLALLLILAQTSFSQILSPKDIIIRNPNFVDTTSATFKEILQFWKDYQSEQFLDINPKFKDTSFLCSLLGYHNKIGKWGKSYDAIFYIKENHKVNKVEVTQ